MEELIKREYSKILTEDEIKLALLLYKYTQNKESTIKVCSDLKSNYYGKTFGFTNTAAIKEVNDEIAKAVCLKLIIRDEDYYNNLPIIVQNKLIELYESIFDEGELKKSLLRYLKLNTAGKSYQYDDPASNKKQEKRSVLAQLREYQAMMNENNK